MFFIKIIVFHLNKIIKRTKSNYYIKVFSDFKNNVKKTWETLNKLTGKSTNKSTINNIIYKNEILNKPIEITEAFNQHFSNVATELESKLPSSWTDPMQFVKGNYPDSMEIPPIDLNLVLKVIKSLPDKKCSIYDFSPYVIKENCHILAQPLALLFNKSINKGKFPQALKLAKITP